ncbi:hypothetical protein HZS_45 [Henneguya salminicola]|nr:hypothetical protein HZS_45 [Henneguya salminicola]
MKKINRTRATNIKTQIWSRNKTSSYDKNGEQNQTGINDHLGDLYWRRQNNLFTWNQFINAVRTVEYTFFSRGATMRVVTIVRFSLKNNDISMALTFLNFFFNY